MTTTKTLRRASLSTALVVAVFCGSAHGALVFENAKPPVSALPAKDTVSGDASWLSDPLTGFGHAVPLRLAVRRLLPPHVQIEYMPDVDLEQPVTWDAGERRKALQAALVLARLRVEVSEKTVTVERFDYTETVAPTATSNAGSPGQPEAPKGSIAASETVAATPPATPPVTPPPATAQAAAPVEEKTHWRFPAGYPLRTCLSVVLSKMGLSLDWQVENSVSWTMHTNRSFDATPRDALKVVRDEIQKYAPISVQIDGNVVTATRRDVDESNVSLGPQARPSEGD
jgi:hypothetical protein